MHLVVAGLDHIGHGKSPGKPALVPVFDYLVDDIITYAVQLRAMYGDALTERRRRLEETVATAREEAERARADLESKTGETVSEAGKHAVISNNDDNDGDDDDDGDDDGDDDCGGGGDVADVRLGGIDD